GGMPIDPIIAYNWAAGRNDIVDKCRNAGLIPSDTAWSWFETEVRRRIFADRDLVGLLRLIDRFSFAKTGPHGTLWIGSMARTYPDYPTDYGVRHLRWKVFCLTVHEYIHTLDHP